MEKTERIADFALNLIRWKDHFSELLISAASSNAPSPVDRQKWSAITTEPSVTEIFAVFKRLNKNKAPGPNNIFAELLNAGGHVLAEHVASVLSNKTKSLSKRDPDSSAQIIEGHHCSH